MEFKTKYYQVVNRVNGQVNYRSNLLNLADATLLRKNLLLHFKEHFYIKEYIDLVNVIVNKTRYGYIQHEPKGLVIKNEDRINHLKQVTLERCQNEFKVNNSVLDLIVGSVCYFNQNEEVYDEIETIVSKYRNLEGQLIISDLVIYELNNGQDYLYFYKSKLIVIYSKTSDNVIHIVDESLCLELQSVIYESIINNELSTISNLYNTLINQSKDLEGEIVDMVNKHFWDLILKL